MIRNASVFTLSSECRTRMEHADMLGSNSALKPERLREIHTMFVDMKGIEQEGILIVADACARHVAGICDDLYVLRFPIAAMQPICMFKGDDIASMEANNSSAFNGRTIAGTSRLSSHAFGMAIDINPLQNPYLFPDPQHKDMIRVFPSHAREYTNRHLLKQGMLEPVIDVFASHGFTVWGGYRTDIPDWHHMQVPRSVAECCAVLPAAEATDFFNMYVQYRHRFDADDAALTQHFLTTLTKTSPCDFLEHIRHILKNGLVFLNK